MSRQLFVNARIYTPVDEGRPRAGPAQGELAHFQQGALLVENSLISAAGEERDVLSQAGAAATYTTVDCGGRCLVPGFVDPHTHMCFAELREGEFALRMTGTPYLEILRRGGGILSSVRAVAAADEDELYAKTMARVATALRFGTTTLEIKSGYGLDTANELKMLRVIDLVEKEGLADVVATFLGAHAVPPAFGGNTGGFIDQVIEEMLPEVHRQGIARFCDVFCEEGVFSVADSRRLLSAAKAMGFGVKLHADEVHDLGGAGLAGELAAISADHLLSASEEGLSAMAAAGTIAVLLPATAYSLRKSYARAREMIDRGLAVALATDCNPGSSFTESMPFVIGLAVINMKMTPAEAITGATLNAAYGIGMADRIGSLDKGKQADFLLLDGETPAILAYHAGVSPVAAVYKKGRRIEMAESLRDR